jgi:hypothetical protein
MPRFRGRFSRVLHSWNATEADWELEFECDDMVSRPHSVYVRAMDIDAPPEIVFRWLCQMRAAPYSYDWIDNWGRQSPRELTPGFEQLEVGQQMVTIFYLADFELDRQVTLHIPEGKWKKRFGDLATTYRVVPTANGGTRLVVKITVWRREGIWRAIRRNTFPWGELLMLRRQMLNFKQLSEQQARAAR